MKPSLLLLCHFWLFSLTPLSWASDSAQGASSLTCWYDSRAALFCDWNPGRDLVEAPCQLEILSKLAFCDSSRSFLLPHVSQQRGRCMAKFKERCDIPKAEHMTGMRRCIKTFSKNSNAQCFTIADCLAMSIHCQIGENTSIPVQIEDFSPLANIKLRPPGNLQLVNKTENTYNLTWSLNISSHYLDGEREYQARYRTMSQSWEEAKIFTIVQDQMWVVFESLSPDLKYEAAVRARPSASSICKGVWSEWSKTILRRTCADRLLAFLCNETDRLMDTSTSRLCHLICGNPQLWCCYEQEIQAFQNSLILSLLAETSRPVLPALIVSTCIFVIIGTAFLINLWTLKWE
ncbi:interleukin-2 receptor subunit beta-like [Podargus strigoides]